MKKFLTLLLALVMALSIVGCGKTNTDEPQAPDTPDDGADAAVTVMTHAEFDAAGCGFPRHRGDLHPGPAGLVGEGRRRRGHVLHPGR